MDLEQKQNLINSDGSINPHEVFMFTKGKSKGRPLSITGTDGQNKKIWDCVDTVKNNTTGKFTKLERYKIEQLNPVILN